MVVRPIISKGVAMVAGIVVLVMLSMIPRIAA